MPDADAEAENEASPLGYPRLVPMSFAELGGCFVRLDSFGQCVEIADDPLAGDRS